MLVSNSLFTIRDLKSVDSKKGYLFSEKSSHWFAGRCLLDVIEYLRTDLKQPGRFAQLACAHAIRLSLLCLQDLNRTDVIQRIRKQVIGTYSALVDKRASDPPLYGDDFWDWAYIIDAFATVDELFPDIDQHKGVFRSEIQAIYRCAKDHLKGGLTFDAEGEWFGPAVAAATFRLLSKSGMYIEDQDELFKVLAELKKQALIPIEEGKYLGRSVAPHYYHWHYGQVVYQFPDESEQLVSYIQDLHTLKKLEAAERAYALARVIQGLSRVNDEQTTTEAINMLIDCEQVERTLGSGVVGDTIKGSLNALEALWPLVSTNPKKMNDVRTMIDSILCLYKDANTIGLLVAIDREASECATQFENSGATVERHENVIHVEHEAYRVVIEKGKAIMEAFDATIRLIDRHHAKWLIMVGIAGSLRRDLRTIWEKILHRKPHFRGPEKGDIVVASSITHYRIREKVRETVQSVDVPLAGGKWGIIPVDPTLFKIAHLEGRNIEDYKGNLHEGLIVTGTGIKDSLEEKGKILKKYPDGLAVEEEGYILGLLGLLRDVPFIVIRGVSDLAEGDKKVQKVGGEEEDQRHAARAASKLAVRIIDVLSREW